jgi:hypothetical protein
MLIAFAILLVLVGLAPFLSTADGVVRPGVVPILVAIGLVMVARGLDGADRQRFGALARPLALGTFVLVVWIAAQLLPLPIATAPPLSYLTSLAHPVWTSAADALGQPIAGRITVDIGATLAALVHVLSLVGIVLLTIAVTLERRRAEAVLVGLTIVSAVIAAIVAGVELLGVAAFAARAEALDIACLGIVLAPACGALAYERSKSDLRRRGRPRVRFGVVGFVAVVAFLLSLGAILAAHSGSLVFVASNGLATFLAVVLVRRLALGRWGAVSIGVTAIVIGVALVAGAAGTNPDPRLAFVKTSSVSLELTQRILADAPVVGTGAGTFQSLVPIYRPTDPGNARLDAVTAAAKISIELGRPMLWLGAGASVVAALFLLRGALRRGRDYFYPAAGAASLVTLTLLAFVNNGLFGSTLALVAAMALGLAFAQAVGTSAKV